MPMNTGMTWQVIAVHIIVKIDDKAYQEFVESISNTSDRNIRTLIR